VEFGGSRNATVLIRWPQVAEDLYAEEQAADQLKGHYERNLLLFDEHLQLNQQCQRAAMEESQPQADDRIEQSTNRFGSSPPVRIQQCFGNL